MSILGLSESRWTGRGFSQSDQHRVMFSVTENGREKGVTMIFNEIISQFIISFNPVSERMLAVRFKGQPVNLTIIQVYAPTSTADMSEINDFFR